MTILDSIVNGYIHSGGSSIGHFGQCPPRKMHKWCFFIMDIISKLLQGFNDLILASYLFTRGSRPFADVEHAWIKMLSFARQNLVCPSNRLFDMRTSKHRKPYAARSAIRLAEIQESGTNSNLPSLIRQQLPWAVMVWEASVKLFAVFGSAS